jgi:amidophosphoribosyltransferase
MGVWNARKAAELTVVGLHANQHRAIDFAGMVTSDGHHLYRERGPGIVRQVFTSEMLNKLHGKDAIGHTRYPTVTDDKTRDNIQPIIGSYDGKEFALAHNGNITNADQIRAEFPKGTFATSMDSECIVRLLEENYTGNWDADLKLVLSKLQGSYSLCILLDDRLVAVRDPSGCRPLSMGRRGTSIFFSSETCAFPNLEATYECDVEAGTIVTVSETGVATEKYASKNERKCRFEGIYFAHPSSTVFGESVSRFRIAMGRKLEEEHPVPHADIVVGVPDSSTLIAMGYGSSGRSGMHFPAIFRNHYVGRTFIAGEHLRKTEVVQKFNFTTDEIKGKVVVVVDDSIVRGTTSKWIISVLRLLEAKEIHVRIGCPPITHPCKYGVNTRSQDELVAANTALDDICKNIGADSLRYLSLEGLRSLSPDPTSFCYACMDGKYWHKTTQV